MTVLDPARYGKALGPLLSEAPQNELGAGKPDARAGKLIERLTEADIVGDRTGSVDKAMAQACVAGLWLRYDFLDRSHQISQEIETPTGSFWHGIMHRREGDFGNAKYWFRRVGRHGVYLALALSAKWSAAAGTTAGDAAYLAAGAAWDAARFVDLVERACSDRPGLAPLCRAIQQAEWEWLFAHCHQLACA